MNNTRRIRRKPKLLAQGYEEALRLYIQNGSVENLNLAMNLGTKAVELGMETLDLALMHEKALIAQTLAVSGSKARDRIIKRAGVFFVEAMVPIERTHNVALEANSRLSRLNESLSRRSEDLFESNLRLGKEIVRRRMVEKNLRQSKENSLILLKQSNVMQEQLRLLSRRILSVQEEERKRISRELHDVIAQMLTGINVRLASLKIEASVSTSSLRQKIVRTQKLVEKSVDVVHRFARELRPSVLDDLGLIPALKSCMKSYAKETGIRVYLGSDSGVERLSIDKRTVLYRVVQEALSNVSRHSDATKVEVKIQIYQKNVRMDIGDNGKGFELSQLALVNRDKRLGLLGIRERVEMVGGSFEIQSAPKKGTKLHVQIPFGFRTPKIVDL